MTYLPENLSYTFPVTQYGISNITKTSTYQDLFNGFLADFGIIAVPNGENIEFKFDESADEKTYYKRVNNWAEAYNEVAKTDEGTYGLGAFYSSDGTINKDFVSANYSGYQAFSFYFNAATRNITNANKAINSIIDIVTSMPSLTKPEQIWAAMNSLGLLKSKLDDALGALGGYMDSESQTKKVALNYTEVLEINVDNLIDLRKLIQEDGKRFANLTIIDKLKFIGAYYAIGDIECTELVFPKGSSGIPCIPNPEYTSATQSKTILGGFEDFYTALVIDRDGPINALSSILETKVEALRAKLSLYSEHIQALNQYSLFINKGIGLLNASQSDGYVTSDDKKEDGNAKKEFPSAAFNIFSALCCGTPARGFFKYNDENYIVVQYDNAEATYTPAGSTTAIKYNRSGHFQRCYMLVKATTAGMDSFCNMYNTIESENYGAFIQKFQKASAKLATTQYSDGYAVIDNDATDYGPQVDNIKFLLFQNQAAEVNHLPMQFDIALLERSVYAYGQTTIGGGTWYGYGAPEYPWRNVKTINANSGALKSWTDAFGRSSGYVDTKIQETNTDISALRTKIDTFDSTSSTFRKRAHDTYTGIVSKI